MSTIMTPKARPVRKLLADADTAAEEKFLAIHKVEVDAFVRLLGRGTVALLLEKDRCCNYADNYLLATVLVYFKRAKLGLEEYTQDNFWRCLYLAHDQVMFELRAKFHFTIFLVMFQFLQGGGRRGVEVGAAGLGAGRQLEDADHELPGGQGRDLEADGVQVGRGQASVRPDHGAVRLLRRVDQVGTVDFFSYIPSSPITI